MTKIDLLFLDVEMKDINGMKTAEEIRKFDKELLIVFVTGYSEYVFDGYRTGAFDYVLKPAEEEQIRHILSRAREHFFLKKEKNFVFQNQDGPCQRTFFSEKRKELCVPESGRNFSDASG